MYLAQGFHLLVPSPTLSDVDRAGSDVFVRPKSSVAIDSFDDGLMGLTFMVWVKFPGGNSRWITTDIA